MKEHLKLLVVRPDRIGDVVLSTPVFELLREAASGCTVDVLVQASVKPVLEGHPFVDRLWSAEELLPVLKEQKYDAALVLQVNAQVALAVRRARIPLRVGPLSKWYSYFCFNAGLRQNRSESKKNEAEYNLELGARMLVRLGFALPADLRRFRARLAARAAARKPAYILLHPGMGGSALNWPVSYYAELIKILTDQGCKVVLGGSPADQKINTAVLAEAQRLGVAGGLVETLESGGLQDYMDALAAAAVVVAPSTGPLHLASGLGKSTVSFYPPIQVQSAVRWGPFGQGPAKVFSPAVSCPEKYKCAGAACKYFDCMALIEPQAVAEEVMKLAKNASA